MQRINIVMITGSNTGIGKEVARQIALHDGIERVYLACRDRVKAEAAQRDLERATGKRVFSVVILDLSTKAAVLAGLKEVPPIDALVMNAGGTGGPSPLDLTVDGVTNVFAQNVLGHAVLLESLIRTNRLRSVAVYVSSEAARGIPMMRIKRPTFGSSKEDFERVISGEEPKARKLNSKSIYGEVKYIGTLWMADLARQYPALRLVSVSPGATAVSSRGDALPAPARLFLNKVIAPFMTLLGVMHSVEKGASRIADTLCNPARRSGEFYASQKGHMTGPLVEQKSISPELGDTKVQRHAGEAVLAHAS